MRYSCNPGALLLARAAVAGLKLDAGSLHDVSKGSTIPTAINDTANPVFMGGSIVTMACGNLSLVDALAISGDQVLATGTLAEAQQAAGPDATLVDFAGRCILPGFIEPHLHPSSRRSLVISLLIFHR